MARIPVKFRRIVAAFNEGAKIRLCESSGSDHSPDNSTDLSDLVNSFIERQNTTEEDEDHTESSDRKSEVSESDTNYLETRERLQSLLACDEEVIQRIRAETQLACQYVGNSSSSKGHYKRQLMSRLRNRGFDAGKSSNLYREYFLGRYSNLSRNFLATTSFFLSLPLLLCFIE